MKGNDKTTRRAFFGQVAAGSFMVNALSGMTQKLFSDNGRSIENQHSGKGIFMGSDKKFVPVMITPYHSSLKIDFDTLSRLIDFYLASGAKGFFANCLSSEMYNLDNEERLALVTHVVKRVNGSVPVVATGSFGKTIEARAEFAKKMYDTGVSGVILITSHFANSDESDTTLIQNFDKFLSLTNPIPLGTYECPSPYKRILTPEVLRYLLATNRLIYHKDTTIDLDKIKMKLEITKNSKLEFYDAHSPNTMFSLQMGVKGMSCIAGNFYPEIFSWMCNNFNNPKRQEDVKWLQSELTLADSIISTNYPLSSKYFLQKRGVQMEINSRTTKSSLNIESKETLNKMHKRMLEWHMRIGIKSEW